jgi:hypothetical protein
MASRKPRAPKPAKSNRGPRGARGVYIIFDRVEDPAQSGESPPAAGREREAEVPAPRQRVEPASA